MLCGSLRALPPREDATGEGGGQLVEPSCTWSLSLNELLEGVSESNHHDEVDVGPPQGSEDRTLERLNRDVCRWSGVVGGSIIHVRDA